MIEHYHRPQNIQTALRLLDAEGPRAHLLAGGTALTVPPNAKSLIDITHLGLNYIRRRGKGCEIGVSSTMAELAASEIVRNLADGILAKACASCGSVQIRNMATIGGNLANASPAADTATPLLALDAVLVVADAHQRRRIPLTDFFTGPGKTVLEFIDGLWTQDRNTLSRENQRMQNCSGNGYRYRKQSGQQQPA